MRSECNTCPFKKICVIAKSNICMKFSNELLGDKVSYSKVEETYKICMKYLDKHCIFSLIVGYLSDQLAKTLVEVAKTRGTNLNKLLTEHQKVEAKK